MNRTKYGMEVPINPPQSFLAAMKRKGWLLEQRDRKERDKRRKAKKISKKSRQRNMR